MYRKLTIGVDCLYKKGLDGRHCILYSVPYRKLTEDITAVGNIAITFLTGIASPIIAYHILHWAYDRDRDWIDGSNGIPNGIQRIWIRF